MLKREKRERTEYSYDISKGSEPSIFRRLPAPRLSAPKAQNILKKDPNFLVIFLE